MSFLKRITSLVGGFMHTWINNAEASHPDIICDQAIDARKKLRVELKQSLQSIRVRLQKVRQKEQSNAEELSQMQASMPDMADSEITSDEQLALSELKSLMMQLSQEQISLQAEAENLRSQTEEMEATLEALEEGIHKLKREKEEIGLKAATGKMGEENTALENLRARAELEGELAGPNLATVRAKASALSAKEKARRQLEELQVQMAAKNNASKNNASEDKTGDEAGDEDKVIKTL